MQKTQNLWFNHKFNRFSGDISTVVLHGDGQGYGSLRIHHRCEMFVKTVICFVVNRWVCLKDFGTIGILGHLDLHFMQTFVGYSAMDVHLTTEGGIFRGACNGQYRSRGVGVVVMIIFSTGCGGKEQAERGEKN